MQIFFSKHSKETFQFRDAISLYIPMVCFCDIPLTMTKEHPQHYNAFAIGLKKSWGLNHGMNPVFYFTPDVLTCPLEQLELGGVSLK